MAVNMSKFAFTPPLRSFVMAIAVAAAGCFLAQPVAAQPLLTSAETCGAATLVPAAEGEVLTRFGEPNPADTGAVPLSSRGTILLTASGAPVSAPAHGRVEFAGPVANLGQVVILNIGADYRVVLTGLDRVTVHTGQRVSANDAIGAMPATDRHGAHLYMELRCGEEPVNPNGAVMLAMQ